MSKKMTLKLDATYSSHTEGHLDDWRKQCKSNEEFIVEAAKAFEFSPECVKWAKDELYDCSCFALSEFVFLGCEAFGAVAISHDGNVETRVFLATPSNFYSGQGFYTYSSRNDARHDTLRTEMYKRLESVTGKTDYQTIVAEYDLAHKNLNLRIWLEQTEYLFAQ